MNQKRHAGNDTVVILWSEHSVDYQTEIILSSFHCIYIILYPLGNGLVRVQLRRKVSPIDLFTTLDPIFYFDLITNCYNRLKIIITRF